MHSTFNKLFRFDILDFFLFSNDHEINISGQRTEVIGRKIQSPCNAYTCMYITILPLTVEKKKNLLFIQRCSVKLLENNYRKSNVITTACVPKLLDLQF